MSELRYLQANVARKMLSPQHRRNRDPMHLTHRYATNNGQQYGAGITLTASTRHMLSNVSGEGCGQSQTTATGRLVESMVKGLDERSRCG